MLSRRFLVIATVLVLAMATVGFTWSQWPSADVGQSVHKNHNERLKEVADEVPEFGGLFLSDDGSTLNVYLIADETDQGKREDTQSAVEDLLGVESGLRLNVLKGSYTMNQLSTWYDQMRGGGIWDQSGVVATDLQETENKLHVAVLNEDDIDGVYAFLDGQGIPRDAVIVVVEE